MRIYVLGVDPGKKCGVAELGYTENGWTFASWALPRVEATDTLRGLLDAQQAGFYDHTHVACERYTIGQRTVKMSRQPDALEVIGVVRGLATGAHASFDLQGVSDAKKLGNPDVLRQLRWWKVGRDADHANDAAAHVLLAVARHFPTVFRRLITSV